MTTPLPSFTPIPPSIPPNPNYTFHPPPPQHPSTSMPSPNRYSQNPQNASPSFHPHPVFNSSPMPMNSHSANYSMPHHSPPVSAPSIMSTPPSHHHQHLHQQHQHPFYERNGHLQTTSPLHQHPIFRHAATPFSAPHRHPQSSLPHAFFSHPIHPMSMCEQFSHSSPAMPSHHNVNPFAQTPPPHYNRQAAHPQVHYHSAPPVLSSPTNPSNTTYPAAQTASVPTTMSAAISLASPSSSLATTTNASNTPALTKTLTIQQVFDDLVARFFLNLPDSEYESFERVFFQLQEAHWFYIDFYCERYPSFTRYNLKNFCNQFFRSCPLLQSHLNKFASIYQQFTEYLNSVPVCGAILLNSSMTRIVMIQSFSKTWSFPRGKLDANETDIECATREVKEEVGYDITNKIEPRNVVECTVNGKNIKLFIIQNVPEDYKFETRTRGEIASIAWTDIKELPTFVKNKALSTPAQIQAQKAKSRKYWIVQPFADGLRRWIKKNRSKSHNNNSRKVPPVESSSISSGPIVTDLDTLSIGATALTTPAKPRQSSMHPSTQFPSTPTTPYTAPAGFIPSIQHDIVPPISYTPSVRFYSRASEDVPYHHPSVPVDDELLATPTRIPTEILSTSPSAPAAAPATQEEFRFDLDSILQPLSMVVAPVV